MCFEVAPLHLFGIRYLTNFRECRRGTCFAVNVHLTSNSSMSVTVWMKKIKIDLFYVAVPLNVSVCLCLHGLV